MSIITFWNNSKNGNIGQTSSVIATATLMAIEHNYKILVISPQLGDTDLEKAYGLTENSAMKFLGIKEGKFNSGIEGIMKFVSSGKISPEVIGDFTKIVLKNRLEIIAGKKESHKEDDRFDFNKYIDVIKIANQYYDMVFIDLSRELNKLTRKILDISTIIICNMEQKLEEIQKMVELQKEEEVITGKKVLYLLNKYESSSKYNVKNLIRNSEIKKDIFTIPYDVMYSDALQDGIADKFMLNPKVRRATTDEEHGFFISQINKFCDAIIYRLQELHILG